METQLIKNLTILKTFTHETEPSKGMSGSEWIHLFNKKEIALDRAAEFFVREYVTPIKGKKYSVRIALLDQKQLIPFGYIKKLTGPTFIPLSLEGVCLFRNEIFADTFHDMGVDEMIAPQEGFSNNPIVPGKNIFFRLKASPCEGLFGDVYREKDFFPKKTALLFGC